MGFLRLFTVDGSEDGIAVGIPNHRASKAQAAADPGLEQDRRIGELARDSFMDHPPHSPNRGLRGRAVTFARGYTPSPQVWATTREAQDAPPISTSFAYLPGKNPTMFGADQ